MYRTPSGEGVVARSFAEVMSDLKCIRAYVETEAPSPGQTVMCTVLTTLLLFVCTVCPLLKKCNAVFSVGVQAVFGRVGFGRPQTSGHRAIGAFNALGGIGKTEKGNEVFLMKFL